MQAPHRTQAGREIGVKSFDKNGNLSLLNHMPWPTRSVRWAGKDNKRMAKYRKKPVVIEAFQIKQDLWSERTSWPEWFYDAVQKPPGADGKALIGDIVEIITYEGSMTGSLGDWIIRGVKGELYPCKDSIFRMTYDACGEQLGDEQS